jgi:transketolase
MTTDRKKLAELMALASGDEKHDPSAYSTLEVLWVLYDRILHYDASNPRSEARDRFILSKGHGPLAFYVILVQKGFFPKSELKKFMKWDGSLGGHPDRNLVPGVEASTGSLGHGFPMAIGVALGLKAKRLGSRVYVLIGDGETNEGSVWEAALLAGNLGLSNLTAILINNHSSTRDLGNIAEKFASFGWHTQVINGRDEDRIESAFRAYSTDRPSLVVAEVKNDA